LGKTSEQIKEEKKRKKDSDFHLAGKTVFYDINRIKAYKQSWKMLQKNFVLPGFNRLHIFLFMVISTFSFYFVDWKVSKIPAS
jgi:hypothetical protein